MKKSLWKNSILLLMQTMLVVLVCTIAGDSFADRKLYNWQLEGYPGIQKEFKDVFAWQVRYNTPPKSHGNLYLWQLEGYGNLEKSFREEISKKLISSKAPKDIDVNYYWQMKEYSKLDKAFQDMKSYKGNPALRRYKARKQ